MKLLFIKNPVLRFVLASIVAIFFTLIVLTVNKDNEGMSSFKEVKNTSDNYGEREDTLTLIARIDAQNGEVFEVLHSETSD
jgi:hypothetical protein